MPPLPHQQQQEQETYEIVNATIVDSSNIQQTIAPNIIIDDENESKASPLLPSSTYNNQNKKNKNTIMKQFIYMSFIYALSHNSVTSVMGLAVVAVGDSGAILTGTANAIFTITALTISSYVVAHYGSRLSLIYSTVGAAGYVMLFLFAVIIDEVNDDNDDDDAETELSVMAGIGQISCLVVSGILGGLAFGVGFTAQGSYFVRASHAITTQRDDDDDDDDEFIDSDDNTQLKTSTTSRLGVIFAVFVLSFDVLLRSLSSVLMDVWDASYVIIVVVYLIIAVGAMVGSLYIREISDGDELPRGEMKGSRMVVFEPEQGESGAYDFASLAETEHSFYKKSVLAYRLFKEDPKMKYMIGLPITWGITLAFLNIHVNNDIVSDDLDEESAVGWLNAIAAATAALSAIAAGLVVRYVTHGRKTGVLMMGCAAFFFMALVFVVTPDTENDWGWGQVIAVYCLKGVGKSVFEGMLRAQYADYFYYEKEAAFSNMVFLYGLSTSLASFLSFVVPWTVYYYAIMVVAAFGSVGYGRASVLYEREREEGMTDRRRRGSDNEWEGLLGAGGSVFSGSVL